MGTLSKKANLVIEEVEKAVVGKENVIELIMAAIVAGGHILIEDTPGVGKTTMAKSFSKAMGLEEKRMQFTPDVMPADLTGFSIYNKESGEFTYKPGALLCNLFLADEINRTSPKTQSALLEVMEERSVTVDGVTRDVKKPFVVIATENPEGSTGTQLLPESQLDRFMICVNMGYPTVKEEVEILKRRQEGDPVDNVNTILEPNDIVMMQGEVKQVYTHDAIYKYIANLVKATRDNESLVEGLSPRASVAIADMSRAVAWLQDRDFVMPEDVREVFKYVASHRVRLNSRAKVSHIQIEDVLKAVIDEIKAPNVRER